MYDFSELNFLIIKNCKTKRKFAELMGLSERSIYLKLDNKREFKPSEIDRACNILGIRENQINYYFFTKKVQKTEQIKEE